MKARWLGILLLAAACDEAASDPSDGGTVFNPGTVGLDSSVSLPGTDGGAKPWTPGGDASVTPPTGGGTSGLPCDVEKIVTAKCGLCHTDPPQFGASMALTKQAHFAAPSAAYAGSTVAARVKVRIADAAKPMPPVGRPALTDAEKQTLNAWLDQGAPVSAAACTTTTPATDGGVGVGPVTGENAPYLPPDSECDYMQELRAHGGQSPGDTTPFEAPGGGDHYEIFYFTPKWSEKVQVTRIDPLIDNAAVLHHWLLYQEDNNGGGEGTHKSDTGLQSGSSALLSGWAPGNDSLPIPKHVGIQTIAKGNARFGIEIHYNTNANPPNRKDRSGARLCVTKTMRPHEASVHWLGTQNIVLFPGMGTAQGRCTPNIPAGGSHIIAHSPHMHITGVHARTVVRRKGASTDEVLWDAPFSFDDQQIYPVPNSAGEQLINAGDVLTTTCTYNSKGLNSFGPNTSAEMCYNFVVAWPVGSLSNGSTGIVGGKNTCIDPGT